MIVIFIAGFAVFKVSTPAHPSSYDLSISAVGIFLMVIGAMGSAYSVTIYPKERERSKNTFKVNFRENNHDIRRAHFPTGIASIATGVALYFLAGFLPSSVDANLFAPLLMVVGSAFILFAVFRSILRYVK